MARTCDEVESHLNDGSWSQPGDGLNGELPNGQSILRAAGLSAAMCVTSLLVQRKAAQRLEPWDGQDGSSPFSAGPIQPHPVASFDLLDESDTESIRKMPASHFIDNVNSSYAGSVAESVRSFVANTPRSRQPSMKSHQPKLQIMKTVGTDPIEEVEKVEKVKMVDRGCSPLPLECFDSDIDSEERFGLACDLWQYRPTVMPGAEYELFQDKQLFVQSEQKKWLKQLETIRREPWKENVFSKADEEIISPKKEELAQADSATWSFVKRCLWGEKGAVARSSSPPKLW